MDIIPRHCTIRFMYSFPPTQKYYRAFTLIELLVVITIIAILVAVLLPVFGAVANSGRKTEAISDEHNLLTAVFAYQGDYNKLPINSAQAVGGLSSEDTVYGDPGPGQRFPGYELMDVLRGIAEPNYNANNEMNPSKSNYFDEPYAKNPKEPRHGLVQQQYFDGKYNIMPGSFVDPWGSEYLVWLDVNHDRNLNDGMQWFYPNYPKDVNYGPIGSVQIGSLGADGNFGINGNVAGSDDILTVQ